MTSKLLCEQQAGPHAAPRHRAGNGARVPAPIQVSEGNSGLGWLERQIPTILNRRRQGSRLTASCMASIRDFTARWLCFKTGCEGLVKS